MIPRTLPAIAACVAFIPAPPVLHFAHTRAAGLPVDQLSAAAYDSTTETIYFDGTLDRSERGHETGHAFDFQVLTDGDRVYLTRLMRLKGEWNQGGGYTHAAILGRSPIETFADWYGNAANGNDAIHSWDASYTSPPDPKRFQRFKRALGRIGRRHRLQPYR